LIFELKDEAVAIPKFFSSDDLRPVSEISINLVLARTPPRMTTPWVESRRVAGPVSRRLLSIAFESKFEQRIASR
jgi:hypothetical protein